MDAKLLKTDLPPSAPLVTHEATRLAAANRRVRAFLRQPSAAAAAGVVLLAVGLACLVGLPFALGPHSHHTSAAQAPPGTQPLPSGVPDSTLGDVRECALELQNPEHYAAAAALAEQATFGGAVASLGGSDAVQQALDALPPLQLPVVFWVLHSGAHPYSARFPAAATTQVAWLNAAFLRSGVQFTLAGLVPVATSDAAVEGCGKAGSQAWSSVDRLVSDPATLVNVVLCDPKGVQGATALLGDGQAAAEGGGMEAQRILLQRAALWQSRTSLVHQMGHFLGLPHPFPGGSSDHDSCSGEDPDQIWDTPWQYRPNTGCDLDAGMSVCRGEDGPLPVYNFMDHTNDTCRRWFTPGQVARMQAMLRHFRPQLYAAAVQGYHQSRLPFSRAFQSGLPPAGVIRAQQASAAAAAGLDVPGALPEGELRQQLTGLGDSWGQAAAAAAGHMLTEPHRCSCLGPDAQGRRGWVGEMEEGYVVDAVRVLRRAVRGSEGGGNCSAEGSDGGGVLCGEVAAVAVEVRVGYSPDPRQNARCSPSPVVLAQPLQLVECTAPLQGRFVSVELMSLEGTPAANTSSPASSASAQQPEAPCLCAVQPLSYLQAPRPLQHAPVAALPAGALPSLPPFTQDPGAALGAGPPSSCSATAAEVHPWWALDTGLDPIAMRGLRLSIPNTCQSSAAVGGSCTLEGTCGAVDLNATATPACPTPQAVNLTVYVGSSIDGLAGGTGGGDSSTLCAANVTVLPGQLVDVDCGRLMHGTAVMVRASFWAPAPLELCGVEVVGASELQLAAALLTAQRHTAAVEPPALRPFLALPIDANPATCLEEPSQHSSWVLPLKGLHYVVALSLRAAGNNVSVSLLDAAGAPVWASRVEGLPGGSSARDTYLEVDAATPAAWVAVHNFTFLCEARLFTASTEVTHAYTLRPRPGPTAPGSGSDSSGSVALGGGWPALTSSGRPADWVADGNYRTCFGTESGEESWVLLRLGGAYGLDSVILVSDQRQPNLTLHTLPPGSAAGFLALIQQSTAAAPPPPPPPPAAGGTEGRGGVALPAALQLSGAGLCAAGVSLERWSDLRIACEPSTLAEAVVIEARSVAGALHPGGMRLCEVGLVGSAAAVPQ